MAQISVQLSSTDSEKGASGDIATFHEKPFRLPDKLARVCNGHVESTDQQMGEPVLLSDSTTRGSLIQLKALAPSRLRPEFAQLIPSTCCRCGVASQPIPCTNQTNVKTFNSIKRRADVIGLSANPAFVIDKSSRIDGITSAELTDRVSALERFTDVQSTENSKFNDSTKRRQQVTPTLSPQALNVKFRFTCWPFRGTCGSIYRTRFIVRQQIGKLLHHKRRWQ